MYIYQNDKTVKMDHAYPIQNRGEKKRKKHWPKKRNAAMEYAYKTADK